MTSSLKSTSLHETDRMVMVGDTHIIDEQKRDDRLEDGAREVGQRLK